MKNTHKTLALWLVIVLLFISLFQLLHREQKETFEISFPQFIESVKKNEVAEVTFVKEKDEIYGRLKEGKPFKTTGDTSSETFLKVLESHGLVPNYKKKEGQPFWQQFLINWGPMIFLFVIFFLFMRQLQIGGGKAMSFGKSRARLLTEHHQKVTFKDVAGIDEPKEELEEIIAFLRDPKKFTRLGGRIPKGVLLMGAPGTGKTLLARAIAGEAGVPFFSISGSDFVEMFVGVGASRVRDLFEQGKKQAPCIIFIDEIDAVGRHRGAGLGGGHDEREQTLNQLLVEMDGFESNEGVILIAATNRPDVLDPALLRPGRFDRRVVVPTPDLKGREGILKVHTRKTPLGPDVELFVIARGTPGFSGADLESLVNEAALIAARYDRKYLIMEDFERAKDKVLMGAERKSLIMSEEEKRNTAYHEAGHTLVAKSIPGADPIHKVTIVPRGRALGLTQTLPTDERFTFSQQYAENMIAFMMGGRAAEEIIFHRITTGAADDIEKATELARKMVCEWGMSVKIGPLAVGKKDEAIFLGREFAQTKAVSEETAKLIDSEIKRIVEENYGRAKQILESKINILHNIATALLENEVLDTHEIEALTSGKLIPKRASKGNIKNSVQTEGTTAESLNKLSPATSSGENE